MMRVEQTETSHDVVADRKRATKERETKLRLRLGRNFSRFNRALNAKVVLAKVETSGPPWFMTPPTDPVVTGRPDRVIVYLGGLPIRTVAQLHEDTSSCSRCLTKLVDNDPEWWTKTGWKDRDPRRDEPYRFKSKFTSRRYCEPCYKWLFPPPKTRTFYESELLDWVEPPYDQKISLGIILDALPGGIKGAILRYMITASAPVVLRNGLIDSIEGFGRESVRKGVGSLISDGLLDESKGPQGLDAPTVSLSQKAVAKYQLELDQKYQQSDSQDDTGAFIDAFPEMKRYSAITGKKGPAPCWAVREIPQDSDCTAGRTTRQKFRDRDSSEMVRRQREMADEYRSKPSYSLSPLDLLIQQEEELDNPPLTWGTLHMLPSPNPSSTPPKERRDRRKKRGVKQVAGRNRGKVGECFRLIKSIFEDRPDGDRPTYAWLADKCDCDSLTPPREALKRFRKSESFKSRLHHASDSWNPPRKRRTGQPSNSA
jgi:hypothetical protein